MWKVSSARVCLVLSGTVHHGVEGPAVAATREVTATGSACSWGAELAQRRPLVGGSGVGRLGDGYMKV